jgi:Icc-related predicted phosphoesterase
MTFIDVAEMGTMKFLILGDLHGNKPNIYFKGFDAIIAPGDFCSDAGIREYYAITYKEFLNDPYNYREWWEITGKPKARALVKESLSSGRKILEFLNSFGVPVYIVPGNWDWTKDMRVKWKFLKKDFFEEILKNLRNIVNLHCRIKDIGEYVLVGYGICNGPELFKYRNYEKIFKKEDIDKNKENYKKLLDRYDKLFRKAESKEKPIIFLSHNVPFNTTINEITNKESPRYGYHYGSLIAREMIDKYQPLVCIGGHMHEHFTKCKVGKTTAINAGFGSYVNVWLELLEDKIKRLEFHRGKESRH